MSGFIYDHLIKIIVGSVFALIALLIFVVYKGEEHRQQRISDCLAEARDRYSALEQTGDMMIAYETARNGCYLANKAPEGTTVVIQ